MPTRQDHEHLKLLGTLTLAYAALVGAVAAITMLYIGVVGVSLAIDEDSAVGGGLVIAIGAVVSTLLLAKSVWMIFSGIGLLNHKWRTLSYVGAGMSCMNFPLGTTLGVFTFLVLERPQVRALYAGRTTPARQPAAAPPPPPPRRVRIAARTA